MKYCIYLHLQSSSPHLDNIVFSMNWTIVSVVYKHHKLQIPSPHYINFDFLMLATVTLFAAPSVFEFLSTDMYLKGEAN